MHPYRDAPCPDRAARRVDREEVAAYIGLAVVGAIRSCGVESTIGLIFVVVGLAGLVAALRSFYRGPGVRAAGAGLGLAVCRGIALAHGGWITAARRTGGGA